MGMDMDINGHHHGHCLGISMDMGHTFNSMHGPQRSSTARTLTNSADEMVGSVIGDAAGRLRQCVSSSISRSLPQTWSAPCSLVRRGCRHLAETRHLMARRVTPLLVLSSLSAGVHPELRSCGCRRRCRCPCGSGWHAMWQGCPQQHAVPSRGPPGLCCEVR